MKPKRKLTDIGAEINGYLRKFEAEENKRHKRRKNKGYARFFWAGAGRSGRFVMVTYISYQGPSALTRDEAERYLAWLEEGNVGRHFEALRDGPV